MFFPSAVCPKPIETTGVRASAHVVIRRCDSDIRQTRRRPHSNWHRISLELSHIYVCRLALILSYWPLFQPLPVSLGYGRYFPPVSLKLPAFILTPVIQRFRARVKQSTQFRLAFFVCLSTAAVYNTCRRTRLYGKLSHAY